MASLYGVSSGDLLMIALLVADLPNIQSVHQVTVYGMLAVCLIAINFVVVYFLDMIVQEKAEKMLHLEFKMTRKRR